MHHRCSCFELALSGDMYIWCHMRSVYEGREGGGIIRLEQRAAVGKVYMVSQVLTQATDNGIVAV